MIRLRPAHTRGRFRNDWLDARFSFSFGDYRDPAFDGYSDLLVFNDDRVAPGGGFAEHGHRDVEVMSYPVAGAVEHRDSLGNVALMRPGDVHLMRAGHGIRHSEMNASRVDPEHHLQWWIRPAQRGLEPAYARIHVGADDKRNRLRAIATPEGGPGVLALAQDTRVFAALVDDAELIYRPPAGRWTHLHVVAGALRIGTQAGADAGPELVAGDAAFIEDEVAVRLDSRGNAQPADLLLFDLRGST